MANRSKTHRPAALRAAASALRSRPLSFAQGRLHHGAPIAVIDIGSNSVRLVIYEGLTRAPTPIFNEKVLAGLGREVQSTGLLAADAVEKALDAESMKQPPKLVLPGSALTKRDGAHVVFVLDGDRVRLVPVAVDGQRDPHHKHLLRARPASTPRA